MPTKDPWERAKELLSILGNETRIEILRLLSQKQCYVSEISRELDVGQQAILRHLKLLSEFKFLDSFEEEIEDENRGRGRKRKYYTIADEFPFKLSIRFSDERFEIKLEEESDKDKLKECSKILETWPGLQYYKKELELINNIKNNFEKLRHVIDLIERLEKEKNYHELAIQYIDDLLAELNKMKENIKTEI
ncbi:MAG: ArsR/SmtB family transcription factor [Candidatus Helarchaeota archaeon]